jgi:hypothetical protein
METKQDHSLTSALGLPRSAFEQTLDMVRGAWESNESLSYVLLQIGRDLQDDELGTDVPLSNYEKKLLLAGWMTGRHQTKVSMRQQPMPGPIGGMIRNLGDEDKE